VLKVSYPNSPVLFLFINNPEKDPKVSIFGNNKEECEKLNWENKIDKINNLFFSWGKRNLTILEKIMIIKALVIPIFTFVSSACVVPDKYRKEIERKCFKFIWDGKPDKVKRTTMIGNFEMGTFISSSKLFSNLCKM
jgi:hypothetical protein